MFKKMYKKNYRSRKTVSPEMKKRILSEIEFLKERISSKRKSIKKECQSALFLHLMVVF